MSLVVLAVAVDTDHTIFALSPWLDFGSHLLVEL